MKQQVHMIMIHKIYILWILRYLIWIVTNLYKVAVRPGKPDEVNISWSLMFGEILSKMQFSSLLIWFAGMADILKHVGNDRPWCVVLTCYQASFKKGQLNSSQWKPHLNSLQLILLNLTKNTSKQITKPALYIKRVLFLRKGE